jgi:hypothetical protein
VWVKESQFLLRWRWGIRCAKEIVNDFSKRNAELLPKALAKAGVVLRTAEKVAQQIAECCAAASELDHARGDCAAKESAAKNKADETRGDFEVGDEFGAESRGIAFRLALDQRLGEQIARAKSIEEAFTGDGVDACRGVSRKGPVLAGNFSVAQRAELGRGENVAVETRAVDGDFLVANEAVEEIAQRLGCVLGHLGANADGEMVGTRERPDVTGHAVQEFDFDEILARRNEIAESDFEILGAKRGGAGEELIACASSENDEIGCVVFASGRELYFTRIGIHTSDARVMDSTSGGFGALEQKAVEDGAGINHQRLGHFKTGAMAAAGNQFGAVNFFFCRGPVEEEWIFFDGLVSEAATAGLFPREMLVKKSDAESGAAQLFGAESPGGAPAHDGNLLHLCEDRSQTGHSICVNLKV